MRSAKGQFCMRCTISNKTKKRGFPGYSGIMIYPRERYAEEKEAYAIEIDIAEKLGEKDIATRLRRNLREEREFIFHGRKKNN